MTALVVSNTLELDHTGHTLEQLASTGPVLELKCSCGKIYSATLEQILEWVTRTSGIQRQWRGLPTPETPPDGHQDLRLRRR